MAKRERVYPSVAELTVRATLAAGLRLVRESAAPADSYRGVSIRTPEDAFRVVADVLGGQDVETFAVLLLDTQSKLMASPVVVSRGVLDGTMVTPREVFRAAVLAGAASIVLAHNPPSGDPTPSPDDRRVTAQLAAAGRVLDVLVVDHIVVGDGGRFVSFAVAGLL